MTTVRAASWPKIDFRVPPAGAILAAELNAFLDKNGLGTAFGGAIEDRYLASTTLVKNAA